jgi:hypothetical protein
MLVGFNPAVQNNRNYSVGNTQRQQTIQSKNLSFGNFEEMRNLGEFVLKNSQRINPENAPKNAVNLTFFAVRKIGEPIRETFQKLAQPVKKLMETSNNRELSYLQLGAEMGDQGVALQTMGLGHLLDEWQVLSPDTVMPYLPKDLKHQMAGMGMVTIANKAK